MWRGGHLCQISILPLTSMLVNSNKYEIYKIHETRISEPLIRASNFSTGTNSRKVFILSVQTCAFFKIVFFFKKL